MRITLRELSDGFAALERLTQTKFPVKVSYRLGRVYASAQSEMEILRKQHVELVKKHGAEDAEKPGNFIVPPENLDAFRPEFDDLMSEECELWGDPIALELLGDAEIEPMILAPLGWLIVDGASEKAPLKLAASGD